MSYLHQLYGLIDARRQRPHRLLRPALGHLRRNDRRNRASATVRCARGLPRYRAAWYAPIAPGTLADILHVPAARASLRRARPILAGEPLDRPPAGRRGGAAAVSTGRATAHGVGAGRQLRRRQGRRRWQRRWPALDHLRLNQIGGGLAAAGFSAGITYVAGQPVADAIPYIGGIRYDSGIVRQRHQVRQRHPLRRRRPLRRRHQATSRACRLPRASVRQRHQVRQRRADRRRRRDDRRQPVHRRHQLRTGGIQLRQRHQLRRRRLRDAERRRRAHPPGHRRSRPRAAQPPDGLRRRRRALASGTFTHRNLLEWLASNLDSPDGFKAYRDAGHQR